MAGRPLNVHDFGGDINDLSPSQAVRPLHEQVRRFVAEEIDPLTEEYFLRGEGRADRWSFGPGQLEILEDLKAKAKEAELGSRLRDLAAPTGAGPHPPLHAVHRRCGEGTRADGRPWTVTRSLRQPLLDLGKNREWISRSRIEIEAMRLMVLKAAKAMDLMTAEDAQVWVSAAKAMVPERVCEIIDRAIQVHGATGLSHWTPLAEMYVAQRALRFADGPDEVHHMVVGRAEAAGRSG